MNVKEAKVARVLCDEDLLFFTRFFFKKIHGTKFITNWHHEIITKALTRIANYEIEFLNINIPPRYSKTELVANFVAQNLGKNPASNWLYITASDDLRSDFSVKIRDIITWPDFYQLYGIELKKDQNGKNLWRTKQGGGLKTATIFGQITGFGAGQMVDHDQDLIDYIREFEGAIILDDINKIGDAISLNANNEKANARIFDTILSRKNSKDTPVINIQQRVGLNDATAKLLEHFKDKPKAESIVLPILIDGKPLWEWKHGLQEIEEMRNSNELGPIFDSQYMQNPKPLKGLMYKKFNTYEILPPNRLLRKAYIDTADTGSDYLCAIIYDEYEFGNYLIDVLYTQKPMEYTEIATAEMLTKHKVDFAIIESNNGGRGFARAVERNCRTMKNNHTTFYWFHQTENKQVRIFSASASVQNLIYYPIDFNEIFPYFSRDLSNYMKNQTDNKHDDAPDALTGTVEFRGVFVEESPIIDPNTL